MPPCDIGTFCCGAQHSGAQLALSDTFVYEPGLTLGTHIDPLHTNHVDPLSDE
jgi:hypothetical protein